jgi:hypothetical protein
MRMSNRQGCPPFASASSPMTIEPRKKDASNTKRLRKNKWNRAESSLQEWIWEADNLQRASSQHYVLKPQPGSTKRLVGGEDEESGGREQRCCIVIAAVAGKGGGGGTGCKCRTFGITKHFSVVSFVWRHP